MGKPIPEAVQEMIREGWSLAYSPDTGFIGFEHPLGGKQSLLEITRGRRDQGIGEFIVSILTAAQQQGQADEEAAAYEQAHRAGESHGRIMAALKQSMQQGGGEVVAWMTPGGDVSRSFYWCLERCLPGQQPRPLYAAQQGGGEVDDPLTLADVAGTLGEIAEGFDGGEYAVSEETRRVLIDFASGLPDHPLFAIVGHYFAQHPVREAALTAAQQQGQAVAWLGSNPRTGVPATCAHKPSPTVMREYNMRPLVYADAAPPSAPVGVDLHDRVEFALRDAGFDYDEASLIARLAQQPAAVDEALAGWIADGDTIPAHLIEAARDAIMLEFGNNGTDGYYKRILVRVFTALAATQQQEKPDGN